MPPASDVPQHLSRNALTTPPAKKLKQFPVINTPEDIDNLADSDAAVLMCVLDEDQCGLEELHARLDSLESRTNAQVKEAALIGERLAKLEALYSNLQQKKAPPRTAWRANASRASSSSPLPSFAPSSKSSPERRATPPHPLKSLPLTCHLNDTRFIDLEHLFALREDDKLH
jgi:hypothetical protein